MIWIFMLMMVSLVFSATITPIQTLPNVLYGGASYPIVYEIEQSSNEPILASVKLEDFCEWYIVKKNNQTCGCQNGTYTCVVSAVAGKNLVNLTIVPLPNLEPKTYNISVWFSGYDYAPDYAPVRYSYYSGGGSGGGGALPVSKTKETPSDLPVRPEPAGPTQPPASTETTPQIPSDSGKPSVPAIPEVTPPITPVEKLEPNPAKEFSIDVLLLVTLTLGVVVAIATILIAGGYLGGQSKN